MLNALRGPVFIERLRTFAGAGYLTLTLALPAGAAGWAAAYGMDALFGWESGKPVWILPLWCVWFFWYFVHHAKGEPSLKGAAEAPHRMNPKKPRNLRRVA
ncbi:hypothetical protein ACFLQ0_00685 [Nitrospinota bacterium]